MEVREGKGVNLYEVLKISRSASPSEIERAYQRLIREARYDLTLHKQEIEKAYKILNNPTSKAIYDVSLDEFNRKLKKTQKAEKRSRLSLKQLTYIAVILFLVAAFFFGTRYGYRLRSFEPGDRLYYKGSHHFFGTIEQVEEKHKFGQVTVPAYLINSGEEARWFPQNDIKFLCYSRED